MYDIDKVTQYIRRAAEARGIDPDAAVRAARSEGLARNTWQSNVRKNGVREPSFGPFQLLVGGPGTGFPTGMGNDFIKATGLDPSNPANVNATIDFALDQAAKNGWQAWYGPKNVGMGRWQGINSKAQPMGLSLASNVPVPGKAPGVMAAPVDPVSSLPALGLPRNVASIPVKPVQEMPMTSIASNQFPSAPNSPSIFDAFKDGGFSAGMNAINSSPGFGKGLGVLAGAFGGGGSDLQAKEHATPIQSTLPAMEAADAGRMQAAQQLMSVVMANRPKRRLGGGVPGLSLMG